MTAGCIRFDSPTGWVNVYAYVQNDPLNKTDPSGRCPWCVAGFFIGGGIDLAAQLYNNGGHLGQVDWGQTGAAAVVGAITGGAGAFIGGAIEGGSALAIAGRAAANAAVGSAGSVGQTAALNNFDGHNDSYVKSAEVGALFAGGGSVVGDLFTGGAQALTPATNATPGEIGLAIYMDRLNPGAFNATPGAVLAGQAVGAVIGGTSSFVPLDAEAPSGGAGK